MNHDDHPLIKAAPWIDGLAVPVYQTYEADAATGQPDGFDLEGELIAGLKLGGRELSAGKRFALRDDDDGEGPHIIVHTQSEHIAETYPGDPMDLIEPHKRPPAERNFGTDRINLARRAWSAAADFTTSDAAEIQVSWRWASPEPHIARATDVDAIEILDVARGALTLDEYEAAAAAHRALQLIEAALVFPVPELVLAEEGQRWPLARAGMGHFDPTRPDPDPGVIYRGRISTDSAIFERLYNATVVAAIDSFVQNASTRDAIINLTKTWETA